MSCQNPASARLLPFTVFMGFIGLDEVLGLLSGRGIIKLTETALYSLYPVKVTIVALVLFRFKKYYKEISWRSVSNLPSTLAAVAAGILVFILWINMGWSYSVTKISNGFNPFLFDGKILPVVMTGFRVIGAVLVVPFMEELFWRSFLIRYIHSNDFEKVPIGHFTWTSFLITVVFFGLEHHLILAGMMAGAVYNLVLYRTRNITQCILAHAVTNLALAIYVLSTGQWQFW